MMRFFSQLMKLPLTTVAYSLEMFAKTMQELQRISNQGVDAMIRGVAHTLGAASSDESARSGAPQMFVTDYATADSAVTTNHDKEVTQMKDQDLSGENKLKLVRYKVLFVKRDYEVAFPEKEELVSYDTGGAEWAGLKVAHFMGRLSKTKRPERWRDTESPYPPGASGEYIDSIPKQDEKYIKVYFEVLQRWDREEAEYDKQQIEVLRQIAKRL